MKISIDIDCSPEEARQFMGLPDVAAMNDELIAALGEKLSASLSGEDPGVLFKEWFSGGFEGFENIQKEFWSRFSGGVDGGRSKL
jgi:hypothetical protein